LAAFRLSRLAEADLVDIGAYTLRTWGKNQALRYIDDLEACCQTLADNPSPVIAFALACAAWNKAGTSCSSGVSRTAFSFLASCMSGCCLRDTPLMNDES
jgi:hypothetical protein